MNESMDEIELTRRVLGDPGEDSKARERVRARLKAAIRAEQRPPRSRGPRFLLPAAAVAATLAIGLIVALLSPFGPSAAATELRRLGAIAAAAEDPRLGPGEYALTRYEELVQESREHLETGVSFAVVSRLRVQTWIAADASGVRRTEVVESEFASDLDRRNWIRAGSPTIPQAGDVRIDQFAARQAPWFDLRRLPDEPGPLLAALRSGAVVERAPGDDQVFLTIGELLAQGDASPRLRAALFEVAAGLEGVELVGDDTDPLGRQGIAVAIDGAGARTQLVFEPDSSTLLAIELYPISQDGSIGPLDSWTAVSPTTVVDSAPGASGKGESPAFG
jgi:hypothetical protein